MSKFRHAGLIRGMILGMTTNMPTNPNGGIVPEFTLGDRLRKARELSGLEMQQLADQIDIHRQTVARYESGQATPKRHVMLSWSMATGVSVEWISTGSQPSQVEQSTRTTV